MIKTVALVFAFTLVVNISLSQDAGMHMIKVGHGIPSMDGWTIGFQRPLYSPNAPYEGKMTNQSGVFFLKYAYNFSDRFSLGLNLAYTKGEFEYGDVIIGSTYEAYAYTIKYSNFSALARWDIHLGDEVLDPYFGMGIGHRNVNRQYWLTEPGEQNFVEKNNGYNLGLDWTAGVNLRLDPAVGIYVEVGLAKAFLQYGLFFRF